MSSAKWEEVKRLAADFQRAQLSINLQRLSERNCVEIISKLTEKNLLNVIFTVNGKEYITPQHLGKEIKDELYMHGGRIDLVELTKILNVDFTQISKVAADIEKNDKGVKRILGQLIDRSYVIKIVREINDKLNQVGFVNITDLTLHYDLPTEFLQSIVERSLGKTINGRQDQQDPKFIYTEGFIARNRAKIRGALSAITKPTPLSAILGQCNVPERIFFSIIDSLSRSMQLPGVISGRQSLSGLYVPTIYSKSQSEWIENFYKQNGYLEYDGVARLGIADPKNYIKRYFTQNAPILLETVAVGPAIIDQIDANIDEITATNSFVDIYPLLPSVFIPEDINILLKDALKRRKMNFYIFANTVIVSEVYFQKLKKSLEDLSAKKAKEAVDSGKWFQNVVEMKLKSSVIKNSENNKIDSKRDERRKKALGGKAGGGSQGRETKMKSVKKKYHPGKNHNSDSEEEKPTTIKNTGLILLTPDDLREELFKCENLADVEDFCNELVDHFYPILNKLAIKTANDLSQVKKPSNLSQIEEKLNIIMCNIKIFDKGIKCLLSKETISSLSKYLMKTLGGDFLTELLKLAAQQNVIQCPSEFTTEIRQKMIQDLPPDVQKPLGNLHKAITQGSVEDFLDSADAAAAACCLVLKKIDKKREKSMVSTHKQDLLKQLSKTDDPALVLHLVTNILFTVATQTALHMSGRHVSSILSFLRNYLTSDSNAILMEYHDWVLKLLSCNDSTTKEETLKLLENGLQAIKDTAYDARNYVNVKTDKITE